MKSINFILWICFSINFLYRRLFSVTTHHIVKQIGNSYVTSDNQFQSACSYHSWPCWCYIFHQTLAKRSHFVFRCCLRWRFSSLSSLKSFPRHRWSSHWLESISCLRWFLWHCQSWFQSLSSIFILATHSHIKVSYIKSIYYWSSFFIIFIYNNSVPPWIRLVFLKIMPTILMMPSPKSSFQTKRKSRHKVGYRCQDSAIIIWVYILLFSLTTMRA